MGRYYSGDIEGKFWFAVQSSDDQTFFGMREDSSFIDYYIGDDDIELIEDGIKECKKALKGKLRTLRTWYNNTPAYTDETAAKKCNMTVEEFNESIVWFARLELGEKIYKCVQEQGSCYMNAEM